jgi:hypothetical protein
MQRVGIRHRAMARLKGGLRMQFAALHTAHACAVTHGITIDQLSSTAVLPSHRDIDKYQRCDDFNVDDR